MATNTKNPSVFFLSQRAVTTPGDITESDGPDAVDDPKGSL